MATDSGTGLLNKDRPAAKRAAGLLGLNAVDKNLAEQYQNANWYLAKVANAESRGDSEG